MCRHEPHRLPGRHPHDVSSRSAEIIDIRADRVRAGLDEGKVVIVAGFQGVDPVDKEVTTLGRGGSDATAVALAAAMQADVCEIYTDVDGIFTADPRLVPDAGSLMTSLSKKCWSSLVLEQVC